MKNAVNDILNSLFSSDKTVLSQSQGSVSSKGSQPNGSTFEDVLAQLASQENGSSSSPAAGSPHSAPAVEVLPAPSGSSANSAPSGNGIVSGSVTSLSETDIRITENVKVDNLNQLAQAEQALVSLAAGLSKLLGALAGVQGMDPSQAQNALVALSGGKITAQDAQSLLSSLQALGSQTPDSKNPLLLSNDQQSAFLNQMLQQMIQNQQVLFGALPSGTDGSASNTGNGAVSSGAIPTTDVFLQMAFSDTQIAQVQQTNTQSSSVFIDLQSFKMSATFIQAGQASNGGSFQPVTPSDSLANTLNQLFSNQASLNSSASSASSAGSVSQQGSLVTASQPLDDIGKNLKDLVQLLMGAGASQAVLTTFLNQQKNLSNADLNQSLSQNLSLDNLVKSLAPVSAIPPPPPTGAASAEINNTVHSQASFSSELFVEEMFAQVSVAGQAQGASAISANGSNPQPSGLEVSSLNAINDVVARLNVLSLTGGALAGNRANNDGKSSPSLEQLISALNAAPSAPTLPADAFSDHPQNNSLTTTQPVLLNPPATVPVSASNIGNDLVNQAALVNVAVAAVNQAVQSQTAQNQPAPPQNNNAPALVPQAQPVQTAVSVGQESVNPADSLLGNAPVSHLLPGFSNAALENNFIPNVSNVLSSLTVQTPVGFSPAVQTAPVPNEAVTAQAPPVSPVSPTVQEVVAPTPVDVQVKVTNPADTSTLPTAQTPAATTPGTTVSVSTAQNVSASVVTGEVVKLAGQTPNPVRSADNVNQLTVNNVSAVPAVQPINPQGVTAVTDSSSLATGLNVSLDQSKNTNNNSLDLSLNSNLLPVVAATIGDKVNSASANQAANNASSLKIDSLQVLNQVSDQITAHASEAKAVSRLSFQLIPESLGRVTVQIALVDQAVSAKIIVSNPDVREVLQHHMVDLKAVLNQAGLQIDQLQVQIQGGSSNLLAQYYQYQQEGFGGNSASSPFYTAGEDSKNLENTGVSGIMSVRTSLLDVLA